MHEMVEFDMRDEPTEESQKLMIDVGTEHFKGNVNAVSPYNSACFECTRISEKNYDMKQDLAELKENPRNAEHCILFA